MAHLYPHNQAGWKIRYNIYFPDGTYICKEVRRKKKIIAQRVFSDVQLLETQSYKGLLTKEEIKTALNLKYIKDNESTLLYGSKILGNQSWRELSILYENYSRNHCREYTHRCNMTKLETVKSYFKDINPGDITSEDVADFLNKRKNKVKSATVRKELDLLRRLLDPLSKDKNPAREVSLSKEKDERLPRPLRPDEMLAFMKALQKRKKYLYNYLRPLTLTYLYAGLRPSELVSLTPEDIDLKTGKIYVQGKENYRTKTGAARSIDIHPKLRVHIEGCIRKGGIYIFGGNNQILSDSVSRAIREVRDEAGIKGITAYSLRHSFITGLLKAGADIRYVMDMAGHKKLSTTLRYLHVIPSKDSPIKKITFKH
ncbi:MAG: site-specific integrase [Thermodesulfobacteriota bacterium]